MIEGPTFVGTTLIVIESLVEEEKKKVRKYMLRWLLVKNDSVH